VIIRKEENKDLEAIIQVTIAAFENHPIGRQTEHFIINVGLRDDIETVKVGECGHHCSW
jgi:hypothetical protein